jgi:hypothetical protein
MIVNNSTNVKKKPRTTTPHIKSLNINKITRYDVENPGQDKRTQYDLQNITKKTKYRATRCID